MKHHMKPRLILLSLLATTALADDAANNVFRVTSASPKYVTADMEFRDAAGAKWPNFFYGKPANESGTISFDPAKPTASFVLRCDKMAQEKGDQSRKVLGALPQPLEPVLTVTAMGPLTPVEKNSGGKGNKATHSAELTGTLELAGKKVPVKAKTGLWVHDGKGDEKSRALMLDGTFTLNAADLGLKTDGKIEVRFGLTAYPSSF
jgi:polyisoprenoid-binding protein YceI